MIMSYQDASGAPKMIRLKTISHAKPITLGRSEEADVTLDDSGCSRIHAAIRYWEDIFIIRDMNSSNGTLLNGEKIDVAKLSPGDVVKIGDTEFSFAHEQGSQSDVTIRAKV